MRGLVKRFCHSFVLLVAGVSLGAVVSYAQDSTGAKTATEISYSKQVAPILDKFCATCHNADEDHPSQLFMDSYETLMKGGKHGAAVKPGNSKESLLIQKMSPEPPFGKVMPPPKKKLVPSKEQMAIIAQWIDQGAKKN